MLCPLSSSAIHYKLYKDVHMTHSEPQDFLAIPPTGEGPGPPTSAVHEQSTSVTLPRTMSLSRKPTSTSWRNLYDRPAGDFLSLSRYGTLVL